MKSSINKKPLFWIIYIIVTLLISIILHSTLLELTLSVFNHFFLTSDIITSSSKIMTSAVGGAFFLTLANSTLFFLLILTPMIALEIGNFQTTFLKKIFIFIFLVLLTILLTALSIWIYQPYYINTIFPSMNNTISLTLLPLKELGTLVLILVVSLTFSFSYVLKKKHNYK